jgi:hypothetical protein
MWLAVHAEHHLSSQVVNSYEECENVCNQTAGKAAAHLTCARFMYQADSGECKTFAIALISIGNGWDVTGNIYRSYRHR